MFQSFTEPNDKGYAKAARCLKKWTQRDLSAYDKKSIKLGNQGNKYLHVYTIS
jgi:hypothetical protein